MAHSEHHRHESVGWLRAAVLGANDGLISTSGLIVGVAAAQASREPVLLSGLAGLVAGALSMAAGEYVSVSSQADTEEADIARERRELAADPEHEKSELAAIYVSRGLSPALAEEVARELMKKDPLGAHARDELGMSEITRARPLQAALSSAGAFAAGAILPVFLVWIAPFAVLGYVVSGATLVMLAGLGALAARLGGAPLLRGTLRVTFWGAVAMGVSTLLGRVFGIVV